MTYDITTPMVVAYRDLTEEDQAIALAVAVRAFGDSYDARCWDHEAHTVDCYAVASMHDEFRSSIFCDMFRVNA